MKSWAKYYEDFPLEKYVGNLFGQREFLAQIVKARPKRVLEVATGSGGMSIFLSQLAGFEVAAIDLDPDVIAGAKANNHAYGGHVNFQVADAFALPFADNSFDLIFHQGFLEHFSNEDIHKLLEEQLRVSPQIIFSVPNKFYGRRDFGDERLLSRRQWEKNLSRYEIVLSSNYAKKFIRPWLPIRLPVQYSAWIRRKGWLGDGRGVPQTNNPGEGAKSG